MKDNHDITSQILVSNFVFKWLSLVKDIFDQYKYNNGKIGYKVKFIQYFQEKILNLTKKNCKVKLLKS